MSNDLPQFLTTREMADLLRVKERKIYDLAATGEIPHSRATGKLIFPRDLVLAWIDRAGEAPTLEAERPHVILGSHDPLLEWAARESGSGLATLFDGSLDGLDRFDDGKGIAVGLHVPEGEGWNAETVRVRYRYRPVVLVEWFWRSRGLIVQPGNPKNLSKLADLGGINLVRRQPSAGSQLLLEKLLGEEAPDILARMPEGRIARDEREAALAVLDGSADAAFGLEASARQFKLDFVPVCEERFDMLVSRRDWFERPFQALLAFCRSPAFAEMSARFGGYRIEHFGTVRFNGG
ncbi:helix-turn-helix transcriptional regulator [Rhizobiales bacterium]|uniref:helix-turn-helix transcriptional regulator n=1 Tax=Hongsoonwoonella zoysiae TaxID=2821844 RepID=UPI0015610BE2|nr:helix-turn-helix transcriptional regulator [Hongsoonwoonella zoysiae]NRG17959.1 helix-turn-helix transcriptional regulator [Hongsoonwoonella zoysiae]